MSKRERPKACPFCGCEPTVQKWYGGSPTKHLVACDHCEVGPQVTGETLAWAIRRWNTRTPEPRDGR